MTNFKRRFRRLGKWFGLIFIVLFLFRFTYGYFEIDPAARGEYVGDFFSSVENIRKNYASEKVNYSAVKINKDIVATDAAPSPTSSSHKYEKTATVKSKTSDFEDDERAVKNLSKKFNAVIQYEQNLGNKGSRESHLLIGVNPDSFDSFYHAIQKIGSIKAKEVTKIDKTNEFRKLNAKKVSLETTLASLNELKSKAGQIGDFISLHDKILEIESQLQELGVELGDFATENEYCTVRFSLHEGATAKQISTIKRVRIALEWTIQYFAIFVFSMLILVCTIFILLVIVDKWNILRNIQRKMNE